MDHMRMQRHGFDIITGQSQATPLATLPQEADEVSKNTRRTSVDTDLSRRTSSEFKDIDFFGYMNHNRDMAGIVYLQTNAGKAYNYDASIDLTPKVSRLNKARKEMEGHLYSTQWNPQHPGADQYSATTASDFVPQRATKAQPAMNRQDTMATTFVEAYNQPSAKEKAEVVPTPVQVTPSIEESLNTGTAGLISGAVPDHWSRDFDTSLRLDRNYKTASGPRKEPIEAKMPPGTSPLEPALDHTKPIDAPAPVLHGSSIRTVSAGSMPQLSSSYLQSPAGAATMRVAAAMPAWAQSQGIADQAKSSPVAAAGANAELNSLRNSLMSIAEARAR